MSYTKLFKKNYSLTTNFFNEFDNLSIQGTLDLMQHVAALHATELNAGYDAFIKKGLLWICARNQIEYLSYPLKPSEVEVVTWPIKATRFYYDRYYKIIDKVTKELIVKGRTRWVIVDSRSRSFVSTDRYEYPLNSMHEEVLFEQPLPQTKQGTNIVSIYNVRPSDIDVYGHVNNSRYGNIVYDYIFLNDEYKVKGFTISYNHEAKLGDELTIKKTIIEDDRKVIISGHKADIVIFTSEITF